RGAGLPRHRASARLHPRGGGQGRAAGGGGGQSGPQAAGLHPGGRLLRFPVRVRVRRGAGRGRPGRGDRRGHPAGRSAEPAVPDGRHGGLHREPARGPVRDPQPEREDHLRLRFLVHCVSGRTAPFGFVGAGAFAPGGSLLPTADDPACVGALDRADALREDHEALARHWREGRVLLVDREGRALAEADDTPHAPLGRELSSGPGISIFLGLDPEGTAWFALDAETAAVDAPLRVDVRTAARTWSAFHAGVFAQARALLHWRHSHRHCGMCGGTLGFERGGWLGRCSQCGREHYPRTDPAITAAVTVAERLLLGRPASWIPRRYSLVAGFVEPGETLEQTVAREVLEETQVRVRACRYMGSQPWPFPGQLML